MTFAMWRCLIAETLKPTVWSLVVILLPLVTMLVVLAIYRGSRPGRNDGTWRHLGAGWYAMGVGGAVAALLAYVGTVCVSFATSKYDAEFLSRLGARVSGMSSVVAKKQLIRNLAAKYDEQVLRDIANTYAGQVSPQSRHDLLAACLASKVDKDVMDWTPLISGRAAVTEGDAEPMIQSTDLMLDNAQRTLYDAKRMSELYASLRTNQWNFVASLIFRKQGPEALADILGNCCDFLPSAELGRLVKDLLNVQFSGNSPGQVARRLAWEAGAPSASGTFLFFISKVRWLRDSLWLLLFLVAGLLMVRQGYVMKTASALFRASLASL